MKKIDKVELAFSLIMPLTVLILTGLLGYYVVVAADIVLSYVA